MARREITAKVKIEPESVDVLEPESVDVLVLELTPERRQADPYAVLDVIDRVRREVFSRGDETIIVSIRRK